MGALLIVRHGQANSLDYDRDGDVLSPLGVAQARKLGERWADEGTRPERVFVGPRRRHRETHAEVERVFAERGLPWPAPEPLAALDEYPAGSLLARGAALALERDPALREAAAVFAETRNTASREFLKLFTTVTRMWVRGELDAVLDGVETWHGFRARVAEGIRHMTTGVDRGATVAAFTSGGAVSVATGHALGIDDERVIELSWLVRNTSITELKFSGERVALAAFNATPHLLDPATITVR